MYDRYYYADIANVSSATNCTSSDFTFYVNKVSLYTGLFHDINKCTIYQIIVNRIFFPDDRWNSTYMCLDQNGKDIELSDLNMNSRIKGIKFYPYIISRHQI